MGGQCVWVLDAYAGRGEVGIAGDRGGLLGWVGLRDGMEWSWECMDGI